jgi:hypothetical protein
MGMDFDTIDQLLIRYLVAYEYHDSNICMNSGILKTEEVIPQEIFFLKTYIICLQLPLETNNSLHQALLLKVNKILQQTALEKTNNFLQQSVLHKPNIVW